ncbi:MAG: hypothetical protein ACO1SX_04880, partial [Actinomycetota bacterium]
MSTPQIDLNALWKYVTDQVKSRTTQPSLWRSMEGARPLTIEDEELILGYQAELSMQAGLMMDVQNKNLIEQVIESATRKRLRIRVIDGETLADWEAYKQQQVEAKRLQEQARLQYQQQMKSGVSWDAVAEQLVRKYSNTPNRTLSSVQGRYLDEAVETLAEAYGRLMGDSPS